MKYILLASLFLVCLYGKCQEYSAPPEFAQKVYDDIYNAMSDGKVDKPDLILSDKPTEVATYSVDGVERKIILGVNFIQLIRNFGKDSSNALAHVLGHELAHVILRQNDLMTTGSGYASVEFNRNVKSIKKIFQDSLFERQADEFAALYAHIAGYRTTGLGTILLDSIYKRFNLTDTKLKRYPTLKERKEIVQFSERKMSTLRKFYDASILCAISENYEMSEALNKAVILENFPSREIHNNIGVTLLMKGISLLDTLEFPYHFPIALDLNTRLNTLQERAITKDAEEYLKEAQDRFTKAISCSQNYHVAWLNSAIVQFILGNEDEYSIALLKLKNCTDTEILNKLEVLKAINEDYHSKRKSATPYSSLCKKGNTYACSKIESENSKTEDVIWPSKLSYLKDFQNPRFDFNNPEAKKANDSLNQTLSVTKNSFKLRKMTANGVIGERWFCNISGSMKQVDIYTLKPQIIADTERSFLEDHCQLIGVFSKKTYLRWNDIFIILNDNNAQFYFIN